MFVKDCKIKLGSREKTTGGACRRFGCKGLWGSNDASEKRRLDTRSGNSIEWMACRRRVVRKRKSQRKRRRGWAFECFFWGGTV